MDRRLVIVGGVPGAGKSTALAKYIGRPGVVVLDPDRVRLQLRWRPLVHLVHQSLAWAMILLGPRVVRRTVILHETATRSKRRRAMLRAATWSGWRPRLLLIDVDRENALAGQYSRGRIVAEHEFRGHWERWEKLRRAERENGAAVGADAVNSAIGHHEIVSQDAIERALEGAVYGMWQHRYPQRYPQASKRP